MEYGFDRLFRHTVTLFIFLLQTVFVLEEEDFGSRQEMGRMSEQQNNYAQHQIYKHLCTRSAEHPSTSEVHKKTSMRCYVSKKRALACDVCKKIFRKSGALKKHLRTHTEERPFKCDVCKKYFKYSNTLKLFQIF